MNEEKKIILVVDDSGASLRMIKAWFEEKHQVILANSGSMALKYLNSNTPDVILLDYEMPVMNGYEVLKKIKEENSYAKEVPVLFLTGMDEIEHMLENMELKPDGYIKKNMDPKKIVQVVEEILYRE